MKKKGIGKKIGSLFGKTGVNEDFLEELEETLIEGDIGARATMDIVEGVEKFSKKEKIKTKKDIGCLIRRLLSEHIKTPELTPEENKTNVV
ncbi:MAG: signal recognition particle receptor subunit alpha, partial [Spirochaetia bacterium]